MARDFSDHVVAGRCLKSYTKLFQIYAKQRGERRLEGAASVCGTSASDPDTSRCLPEYPHNAKTIIATKKVKALDVVGYDCHKRESARGEEVESIERARDTRCVTTSNINPWIAV